MDEEVEKELDEIQEILQRGLEKVINVIQGKYPHRRINTGMLLMSVGILGENGEDSTGFFKAGKGDYYSQYGLARSWVTVQEKEM